MQTANMKQPENTVEVDSAAISRQAELSEVACGISWSPVL